MNLINENLFFSLIVFISNICENSCTSRDITVTSSHLARELTQANTLEIFKLKCVFWFF